MQEVLPGVWDWAATHPRIGLVVHSHCVHGTLIDPLLPKDGGIEAIRRLEPERIVLVNRHHDRHAQAIVDELGLEVLAPRAGMLEFDAKALQPRPYDDGEIAPGIVAYDLVDGWFGENALHVAEDSLVVIADLVIRDPGPELSFVPEQLMGDDAEAETQKLRAAVRRVLELDFDNLLLGHGAPWIGGAKDALADFVG